MAIGAREFIDKLLVEKYAQEKVDNHDENAFVSRISADEVMTSMNASANYYKTMLGLNARLTSVCYGVVSQSAKYVKTEVIAWFKNNLNIKPLRNFTLMALSVFARLALFWYYVTKFKKEVFYEY